MNTDELIEKAAKAIFEAKNRGQLWADIQHEGRRESWREIARTALAVFEQAQPERDDWEYEYRDQVIAGFPRPKNVRVEHQRRLIGPWEPVEATDE